MTTLSLSHPRMTKDRTEPYLNKLVKDLIKDYKEQELDVQELALFLKDHLYKRLYCGRKGKRYAMEVITTAKKLPLDNLKDIKDNSGKAQNQQDSNRDKKQKIIPRWLLSWKIS